MHMHINETREKKTRMKIKRNNFPGKGNRGSNTGDETVVDQNVQMGKPALRINLSAAQNEFHEMYLLQIKLINYMLNLQPSQGQNRIITDKK